MIRVLIAFFLVLLAAPGARADGDAVALLPLDAGARLEIYGQPVASEVARVIGAARIDVVVVGAKMAVPQHAKLIVDGTIAAGKKDAIVLTLRIRNPVDGVVLSTVSATAASIATIDQAAAEVSNRLLVLLQERLAAQPPPAQPEPVAPAVKPPATASAPEPRPLLVAISMGDAESEPLRAALTMELDAQVRKVLRTPQLADPATMGRKQITSTVKTSKLDLGIALEIASYHVIVEQGIPTARAHVRFRVSDAVGIVFDRAVVTDTIVGDAKLSRAELAARVAREVLDIARPHLKRKVTAWR